jgi:hypothetical protein
MEKMWFKSRKVIRSIFTHEENHTVLRTTAELQEEIEQLKAQNQRLKDRLDNK